MKFLLFFLSLSFLGACAPKCQQCVKQDLGPGTSSEVMEICDDEEATSIENLGTSNGGAEVWNCQ